MIPCLSLVTTCETETVKAVEDAARGGFTSVEFWWPRLKSELEKAAGLDESLKNALVENQITPVSMAGLGLELVGSNELWQESVNRALEAIRGIQKFNIPLLVFTPGITHEVVHEGLFVKALERLAFLVELAKDSGIQLALEPRSDSRWLTSLDTAAALVSQLQSPDLGLCLDLFHFYTGPSKLEDINPNTIGLIKSVQLCDLIGTPRELARDSDRILPGEGDFDLVNFITRLSNLNYAGLLGVEVPNPHLWMIPADRVADLAYQSVMRLIPSNELPN